MSIYRVIFTWKGKELELKARSLDLTHPYFVSIKDLIFPEGPRLIINPAEDELLKNFGKSKHIMIPFQTVHLIEELMDEEVKPAKVRTFKVIEGEQAKKTTTSASKTRSTKARASKPRLPKSRASETPLSEEPTET
ncbi:MAG: DUF1820 family protein [Spirochaetes bacterium]|nr:DUF1820 family protein [Spirochaetota bacterium]